MVTRQTITIVGSGRFLGSCLRISGIHSANLGLLLANLTTLLANLGVASKCEAGSRKDIAFHTLFAVSRQFLALLINLTRFLRMTTAYFHDFSALLTNSCSSRSPRHWARASRVTIKIGVGKRSHNCGHFFAASISGGLNPSGHISF